jgi:hypothetical protein
VVGKTGDRLFRQTGEPGFALINYPASIFPRAPGWMSVKTQKLKTKNSQMYETQAS